MPTYSNTFIRAVKNISTIDCLPPFLEYIETETVLRHLGKDGLLVFPLTEDTVFLPSISGDVIVEFMSDSGSIHNEESLIVPIVTNTSRTYGNAPVVIKKKTAEDLFKEAAMFASIDLREAETPGQKYVVGRGFIMNKQTGLIYMMSGFLFRKPINRPIASVVYIHPDNFTMQNDDPMSKFLIRKLIPARELIKNSVYSYTLDSRLPLKTEVESPNKFVYKAAQPIPGKDFQKNCRNCLLDNLDNICSNLIQVPNR